MININELQKYKKIHFIGIGGVSMSGIAAILSNLGITITGSDRTNSETIASLISKGIQISIGHDTSLLQDADLVVYTAAVHEDDIEMIEAKRLGIQTLERADFLGILTKYFKNTICISGTHGKTTTTSMVSLCFLQALKNPTIQVGAYLKQLNANYSIGDSEYFIIEACEYVESFLKFHPKAEIILNIDNDHLDYFKNFDNICHAFEKYVHLLPDDGVLVVNGDDKTCLTLNKHTNAKFITYGIENVNANFVAKNIHFDNKGFPEFDVTLNNNFYGHFKLSVLGIHNVLNALSCITLCDYYNLNKEDIKLGLSNFTGAHRRFEFVGTLPNNVSIFDDYAHHPTEIQATYNALKNMKYNSSWAIFQPHTYTRTKNHLVDFAKVLSCFDNILIMDIYSAREQNTVNISSKDLVDEIEKLGKHAIYVPDFENISKCILDNIQENDIILTIGAGDITNVGPKLLNIN